MDRKRLATVFGWLAGGSLALLANYGAYLIVGPGYPLVASTFVLFLLGAFGGMAVADRLGERAFKPLGIAAGVLLALAAVAVVTVLLGP